MVYNQEEVRHFFTPKEDVMYSWVKRGKDESGKTIVTDVISFFNLPSTCLKKKKNTQLKAAYSYFTIATSVPKNQLWKDTLILAKNNGFDLFNCLDNLDN